MADSGGISWDNPIPLNIDKMMLKLGAMFKAATEFKANDCQSYMRTNAPWKDQTGNARGGLFAKGFYETDNFGINLFHTVPYGIFLETKFSGRYAIIDPTLAIKGPEFMDLISGIIDRAGGGA